MAQTIVIRCPLREEAVSTGLTTDSVIFATLPDVWVSLQCPLCGKPHHWRPGHAWLEERPDDNAREAPGGVEDGGEQADHGVLAFQEQGRPPP